MPGVQSMPVPTSHVRQISLLGKKKKIIIELSYINNDTICQAEKLNGFSRRSGNTELTRIVVRYWPFAQPPGAMMFRNVHAGLQYATIFMFVNPETSHCLLVYPQGQSSLNSDTHSSDVDLLN